MMYLSLKNIGKKFNITGREFWVLKDINLEIEKGIYTIFLFCVMKKWQI
ncbi:peptide ABC transporter ATP-binding protein [Clostridium botulinum Af84]|nr:peptide ABC transporter ATP-binding protein [Clostridium botulinum Af84]